MVLIAVIAIAAEIVAGLLYWQLASGYLAGGLLVAAMIIGLVILILGIVKKQKKAIWLGLIALALPVVAVLVALIIFGSQFTSPGL